MGSTRSSPTVSLRASLKTRRAQGARSLALPLPVDPGAPREKRTMYDLRSTENTPRHAHADARTSGHRIAHKLTGAVARRGSVGARVAGARRLPRAPTGGPTAAQPGITRSHTVADSARARSLPAPAATASRADHGSRGPAGCGRRHDAPRPRRSRAIAHPAEARRRRASGAARVGRGAGAARRRAGRRSAGHRRRARSARGAGRSRPPRRRVPRVRGPDAAGDRRRARHLVQSVQRTWTAARAWLRKEIRPSHVSTSAGACRDHQ